MKRNFVIFICKKFGLSYDDAFVTSIIEEFEHSEQAKQPEHSEDDNSGAAQYQRAKRLIW